MRAKKHRRHTRIESRGPGFQLEGIIKPQEAAARQRLIAGYRRFLKGRVFRRLLAEYHHNAGTITNINGPTNMPPTCGG